VGFKMTKPTAHREFELFFSGLAGTFSVRDNYHAYLMLRKSSDFKDDEYIRVIEASAVQDLLDALEFYANEDNWETVWLDGPTEESSGDVQARIDFDDCEVVTPPDGDNFIGPAGKRARAALTKFREGKVKE
jgi:hypothetical protein